MTKITITEGAMAKLAAMTTAAGSMTMTDELVKRLRSANDESFVETLCGEAAVLIKQLTAERDRLREALEKLECKCSSNCDWLHDDVCPSWIARAALKGESHE